MTLRATGPREALRARADAWGRYAATLAGQLRALETGDLEAFDALAELRDEVAAELDALPALPPGPDETAADPELARLRDEARLAIRLCAEADTAIRIRLQRLREQALASIRDFDGRQQNLRRYLQAEGPAARLDVRL